MSVYAIVQATANAVQSVQRNDWLYSYKPGS